MSVKIEVSYERDEELLAVTDRLKDLALRVSKKEYRTGRYCRVYLWGEALRGSPGSTDNRIPQPSTPSNP